MCTHICAGEKSIFLSATISGLFTNVDMRVTKKHSFSSVRSLNIPFYMFSIEKKDILKMCRRVCCTNRTLFPWKLSQKRLDPQIFVCLKCLRDGDDRVSWSIWPAGTRLLFLLHGASRLAVEWWRTEKNDSRISCHPSEGTC